MNIYELEKLFEPEIVSLRDVPVGAKFTFAQQSDWHSDSLNYNKVFIKKSNNYFHVYDEVCDCESQPLTATQKRFYTTRKVQLVY